MLPKGVLRESLRARALAVETGILLKDHRKRCRCTENDPCAVALALDDALDNLIQVADTWRDAIHVKFRERAA